MRCPPKDPVMPELLLYSTLVLFVVELCLSDCANAERDGSNAVETAFRSLYALQVFGQRHYWSMELGNVVCIGISTVRFRSNAFRCAWEVPLFLGGPAVLCSILCNTVVEIRLF